MEKCSVCGGKKGARECPAVKGRICSVCCGTGRQRSIRCPKDCEILMGSTEYRLEREVRTEITDRIGDDFRTEKDEILDKPGVEEFAKALERGFIRDFYHDGSVKDGDIRAALERIYAGRTGRMASLVIRNRPEELVFAGWEKADRAHPGLSAELKTAVIVRIVKSIRESTGGARGDHGYLDMLHDDFGICGLDSGDGDGGESSDEWVDGDEDGGLPGPDDDDGGEGTDGARSGRRDSTAGIAAGLRVSTLAHMTAMVLAYAEAEEPEEVGSARRIFKKEFGWLARHVDKDWSDPVMDSEFALWFCTQYDFLGNGTPVEMFRQERRERLDEGAKAIVNALRRSVQSIFAVEARDGRDYTMADCRTGYRYLVRTVDLSGPLEIGRVVAARIAWNPGEADGSHYLLGMVLPMKKEAAEKARQEAASEREEAARWRGAFLKRFGRADPMFGNGEAAHRALLDLRDEVTGKKTGGKRRKGAEGFPTEDELWEMTVGPWEELIDEQGPVALMFESDGLHASAVYPGLLEALESVDDAEAAREALRRAVEDEEEIPLTSLRRLLEEHRDRAVRLLSGAHPNIKSFEDVKRLVERRRAEPFDLVPGIDLSLCIPR